MTILQLVAALVERAEQQRGEQDADRVVAAHQRHGDADEAGIGDIVEHQPILHAHHLVDRHHAGQRARHAS